MLRFPTSGFVALLAVSAHLALAQAPPAPRVMIHPEAAWADEADPGRKIALRDGKLWLIDGDQVRIVFPVVGGTETEIEVCWADLRTTLRISEEGKDMTLKGALAGKYHRLSALPPQLDLRPVPVGAAKALPAARRAELLKELERRGALDQQVRTGETPDFKEMTRVDADNSDYLKKLIAEVGWIAEERFGPDAALTAFLIVQHSDDIPLMLAALPEIRREMKPGTPHDGASASYALLYDRLTLTLGGLQRYGSQIGIQPGGKKVLRAMEDAEHVDQRRKDLGMEPLAAYVARFGVSELPRIDEHCRQVGFIKAAPAAPAEDSKAGEGSPAPASSGASTEPVAAPAGQSAALSAPSILTTTPAATGTATRAPLPEGVAWQDSEDPARRVALRGGRLWIAEKGRLARALPVVASEPGRLWVCNADGNRKAIDFDLAKSESGEALSLRGEELGRFRRLDAVPSELILLPLDWSAAALLPPARIEEIRVELGRRARYAKLPLGSRDALDKKRIEDLDAESASYLRKLTAEAGWIDEARFGREAALAALDIVLHSRDLRLVQAALPEIKKRLGSPPDPFLADAYARLFDRHQLLTGGMQRYGTQLGLLADRRQVIRPLEEPEKVDDRRRELGLGPISEELARSGASDALVLDARCEPIAASGG